MNIQEEKEKLLRELQQINEQMDDEAIKSASNEELLEYLELVEKIKARLKMLEE